MDATVLTLSFLGGLAAGALFFLGLWWTTQRAPRSARPGVLMLGSFLVRLVGVLGVFALVIRLGDWPGALAALAGFVLARLGSVGWVRRGIAKEQPERG